MLKKGKITSFTLAMITVALLGNLRGFTFLAGYGIGSIFFFFLFGSLSFDFSGIGYGFS